MGLLLLMALLGAIFAALNWLLIPRLEESWSAASIHAKYAKAGTIAALTTLRTFVQIAIWAAVVTLAAASLIWLGGNLGWDVSLNALHEITGWALGWLKSFAKAMGVVLFWLAVTGLGWLAYRAARNGIRGELDREFASQKQALVEQWREGNLPELPPNDDMDKCAATLAQAQALRDSLAEDPVANKSRLEAVDETIGKLVSYYVNADLDRRVDLAKVPLSVEEGPGSWPRIRVFVFSKGTLKLGERSQKFATRLATAAACVAVVGVSAPALANGAIAPLFASLTDLRVFASAEQAARTLSVFARLPVSARVQPPDDSTSDGELQGDAYARAATQFVRALAQPEIWTSGVERSAPGARVLAASTPQQRRELGGAMIREALLREYVSGRSGAGFGSEGLAGLAQPEVQQRYGRLIDGLETEPSRRFSGLVGRVESYFRVEGARNPSFEARLRAGLSEFRTPVTTWDYASAALGDVVGGALAEALPEAGSDLGKLRPTMERTAFKKAVERAVEIKLANFLTDVRNGVPLERSLRAVAGKTSAPLFQASEAAALARRFETLESDGLRLREGLTTQAPSLRMAVSDAERARARPFASLVSEGLPSRRLAGALGNYDALFEANARSVSATALAEVDSGLANAAAIAAEAATPGGGGGTPRADRAPGRFAQARSSIAMGRSFRVGGVVIGAMPQAGSEAPDFIRLLWTRRGDAFDLTLERDNDRRVELGTHSAEMIQLALAYAADARTVAVTMTSPSPVKMPMLRVNLHPALLDTRLGSDIIALDRFVDEADAACEAGFTPTRRACLERKRASNQLDLYSVASAMERGSIEADSIMAIKAAGFARVAFPADWSSEDRDVSIFAYHPSYFDSGLVRSLQSCASERTSEYWGCIRSRSSGGMSVSTPPFTIWSGVREAEYSIGSGWLTEDSLRFMVQVAFDPSGADDEPQTVADDGKSPWEFPMIAKDIERDVAHLIQSDPDHARVAANAERFIRLQRIFRLALADRLGPRFQSGDLLVLMRDAKRAAPIAVVPTPHWSRSRSEASDAVFALRIEQLGEEAGSLEHRLIEYSLAFIQGNLADSAVRFSGE